MIDHIDAMNRVAEFRRRTVFGGNGQRGMTAIYPMTIFGPDEVTRHGAATVVDRHQEPIVAPRRSRFHLSGVRFKGLGGAMARLVRSGA